VQWYWGRGNGTANVQTTATVANWLMSGIMYAGPKLTPQTFKQGYFAIPAAGGAADDDPYSVQYGYGRTAGLPYDEYLRGTQDYTVVWWDPDTQGSAATAGGAPQPGTYWWLDGAQRYAAGRWPTKALKFFDKSSATYQFRTRPRSSQCRAPAVPAPPAKGNHRAPREIDRRFHGRERARAGRTRRPCPTAQPSTGTRAPNQKRRRRTSATRPGGISAARASMRRWSRPERPG
jgi:hypothetical protein